MATKTILIVDDSQTLLNVVRITLQQQGYRVIEAENGEMGLIQAIKHIPDLVILDVEMPKMRGWEVCNRIKNNNLTQNIPVLMLTSRGELSDILTAMQQGADDYLTKPFESAELLERVRRLLPQNATGT